MDLFPHWNFNQRLKTIVESANVRVDEKFRIQERIHDYDFDGEFDQRTNNHNVEQEFFMKLTLICRLN